MAAARVGRRPGRHQPGVARRHVHGGGRAGARPLAPARRRLPAAAGRLGAVRRPRRGRDRLRRRGARHDRRGLAARPHGQRALAPAARSPTQGVDGLRRQRAPQARRPRRPRARRATRGAPRRRRPRSRPARHASAARARRPAPVPRRHRAQPRLVTRHGGGGSPGSPACRRARRLPAGPDRGPGTGRHAAVRRRDAARGGHPAGRRGATATAAALPRRAARARPRPTRPRRDRADRRPTAAARPPPQPRRPSTAACDARRLGGASAAGVDAERASRRRRLAAASPAGRQYATPGTRDQQAFISLVAPGAIAAQQRCGVPAAVTIAQAIEESAWGQQRPRRAVPQPVRHQGNRPGGQREPADLGVPGRPVGDDRRAVPRLPQRRRVDRRPRRAARHQRLLHAGDGRPRRSPTRSPTT